MNYNIADWFSDLFQVSRLVSGEGWGVIIVQLTTMTVICWDNLSSEFWLIIRTAATINIKNIKTLKH